jgi:hypothetical protein
MPLFCAGQANMFVAEATEATAQCLLAEMNLISSSQLCASLRWRLGRLPDKQPASLAV